MKKKARIYISGKITGLPQGVAENKFESAEHRIVKAGHEAINPMKAAGVIQGLEWRTYMGIAYALLHDKSVDAIYMLDNWWYSKGACIEWGWAKVAGIRVFYQNPKDRSRFKDRSEE